MKRKESPWSRNRAIFPGLVPTENSDADPIPFDIRRAEQLKAAVQKYNKTMAPISVKLWAKHFAKLRRIDQIPKKEIRSTLNWYIEHFNQDYIPQAYSASGFRSKYASIHRAMLRDKPVKVKVSPHTQEICESLKVLNWPKGTQVELLEVVQLSLDRYTDFIQKREKASDEIARGERKVVGGSLRQFVGFHTHLQYILNSPKVFVLAWMRQVNDKLESWESWEGSLKSMAFNPTSKQFHRLGRSWAQDYCQDPGRWDFYLECLK